MSRHLRPRGELGHDLFAALVRYVVGEVFVATSLFGEDARADAAGGFVEQAEADADVARLAGEPPAQRGAAGRAEGALAVFRCRIPAYGVARECDAVAEAGGVEGSARVLAAAHAAVAGVGVEHDPARGGGDGAAEAVAGVCYLCHFNTSSLIESGND